MSETRVSNRYAKSLIDLAKEQNILEQVFNDIEAFKSTVDQNSELGNLLKSPIVDADKKNIVLNKIFAASFNQLTIKFFEVVIRKKREYFLNDIAIAFIAQYRALKNITTATVTTASEMSSQTLQDITQLLEKNTGKKVIIDRKINPTLIGGMVVQIEDKLFDASISGKLRKAKQELLNTYISK
jgi:F-type H+-transporting ATPase subunit delta